MTTFSYHGITQASSFKYYIFRTLVRYKTGTLQDTLIIHLGVAMLLALRRPFLHQLHGVAQCTFARAKTRRAPSMQTDRLMTSSHGQASTSRVTRPK